MKWEKKGAIYCPDGEYEWERDTFMTLHAMKVEKDKIRISRGT